MPDGFLLENAQVLGAPGGAPATHLAVVDGRIAAVGGDDLRAIYGGGRRIDLEGRTLLPGINDSHLHLGLFGSQRPPFSVDVSFPAVRSVRDIAEVVRQAALEPPADGWIRGNGWDLGFLEECASGERLPTRHDLDAVCSELPVLLQDFSAHMVWVNSKALELAGVTAATEPPRGGVIVRDEHGEPTGLLQESAQALVQSLLPPLTREAKRAALESALSILHRNGITSATDAALGPGGEGLVSGVMDTEALELLAEMLGPDGFPLRLNVLLLMTPLGTAQVDGVREGLASYTPPRSDPDWFRVAGVKLFADGIPPNKTAWMHHPYHGGGCGGLTIPGESDTEQLNELREMVQLIHDTGYQIGVHVTGDRAIDAVVNAFVEAQRTRPRPDPRHYVIHGDFVSARSLSALAQHGFGLNMQPAIKWTIADLMEQMLGAERAAYQWPLRSALDAGVRVASSSDAPVTYPNWLQGAAAAVLRESKGSGTVFGPEERISVPEAIGTYTAAGAWQDGAEHWKGDLTPGKVADLCVVDARLLDDDPHAWAEASVAATIVEGNQVYGDLL